MKNEGLKVGLAGLLGCLFGTMLVWHYTHQWWAIIIAFPVSFLVGWIVCAPVSFFAAFPRACRVAVATSWRPDENTVPIIKGWLGIIVFSLGIVTTALLPCVLVTLLQRTLPDNFSTPPTLPAASFVAPVFGSLVMVLGIFLLISETLTMVLFVAFHPKLVDCPKVEFWVKLAKCFNSITLPFLVAYWAGKGLMLALGWFVIEVAPEIPGAMKTVALSLPRLIRAWANLTASNLRLTSGCAATIGLFICLWQNWPPVPGCLAGFVAGVALVGSAKLALRYLPRPTPQPVSA